MKILHSVQTKFGKFDICQEWPGSGLIWVREIGYIRERSQGAFYKDMGGDWHPDPVVACVQGIRAKCSKIRRYLK